MRVPTGAVAAVGRGHCARCWTPFMCVDERCTCHDLKSTLACPEDGSSIFEACRRLARPLAAQLTSMTPAA